MRKIICVVVTMLAALLLASCAIEKKSQTRWLPSPVLAPALSPNAPGNLQVEYVEPLESATDPGFRTTEAFLLHWTDNSDNELGFIVISYQFSKRQVDGVWITEGTWKKEATLGPNTHSYTSTGWPRRHGVTTEPFFTPRATAFRVKAFNAAGHSSFSNVAWDCQGLVATPEDCTSPLGVTVGVVTITSVPTGLNGTQNAAINKIYLSWDEVPGASEYRVYHYDAEREMFTALDPTVPAGTTSAWAPFGAGTSQAFRVSAIPESGNESGLSEVAIGWAASGAPIDVRSTYGDYLDKIVLEWPPVQVDLDTDTEQPRPVYALEYDLYQQTEEGWLKLGSTGVLSGQALTNPRFTVVSVTPNLEYAFKVVSIFNCLPPADGQCESELVLSPVARGCAGSMCKTLPSPAEVTASEGLCSDCDTPPRIDVSWSTVTGARGYILYRAPSPWGPWTTMVAGTLTARYTDTGDNVIPWTSYLYCVQAVGAQGEVSPSACDWGYAGRLPSIFDSDLGRCFPSCEHPDLAP